MAASVVARSLLRSASTSVRASAPRISGCTRTFRSRKPLSHRIFRSPVEMSCVTVESLFPFHTATASALLTSMLSTAPCRYGWLIDVCFHAVCKSCTIPSKLKCHMGKWIPLSINISNMVLLFDDVDDD
ncbi:putative protein NUCLEAR FUSION DEFECTIVE 6, chloroplastic/mitochondrial [Helianthus annuus]|uniref:Protein NUCLEAR FUSION DEFECTIVE 6, chloroplastic/mitochondrial-like n=1 Tax=Helianthus annuus TaxID=4232 RepID=A0A251VM09_HELAN|nr:protein NUCLEAR FUSION DEFECTIVE 6, mitochondrial isoform X2 [Helianthus annuus]KAF5820739.1 putative protein NUCLEAR FUSION DEFECTIVE 6, chloroplastic/mitochondrial [Helianthus annuus]KAJ0955657.1 putative protein NUCLEAR FUSION DEFECTIVE 6, chloroplastic/mitochondrial [Helianthus annuus]